MPVYLFVIFFALKVHDDLITITHRSPGPARVTVRAYTR
jgi:hypothetical protein